MCEGESVCTVESLVSDTNGAEKKECCVRISEIEMHARVVHVLGVGKGKVSCLERFPQFRGLD